VNNYSLNIKIAFKAEYFIHAELFFLDLVLDALFLASSTFQLSIISCSW